MAGRWTIEEDAYLRQQRWRGYAYSGIGRMLGRTAKSCEMRAHTIGLTDEIKSMNRKWALLLRRKGKSYKQIAKEMGISENQVTNILRSKPMKKETPPPPPKLKKPELATNTEDRKKRIAMIKAALAKVEQLKQQAR